MAMTPKIITSNTALAAVTMLALLAAFVWGVVEFAPGHTLVQPANLTLSAQSPPREPSAPAATPDVPFSPDERPEDPARCAVIADRVVRTYGAGVGADNEELEALAAETAVLVNEYLDARCPTAIHEGHWHTTAQILGVGIVHDVMRSSSPRLASGPLEWDPRAASLVEVAVSTFRVISPSALCEEALLQHQTDEDLAEILAPLVPDCTAAFEG